MKITTNAADETRKALSKLSATDIKDEYVDKDALLTENKKRSIAKRAKNGGNKRGSRRDVPR